MARPFFAHRFVVSLVTVVAFAAAQIPMAAFAQNSAQAEVLFKEGQQLMSGQKYPEACQRLTASFKLDPQPNTELLQGLCFSKLGKTASAYNAFIDAASMLPKGSDSQKYAADQAKGLEAGLLKVKVELQPIPPGVAIRFDDEVKTRDKDFIDLDIALDPGEHDVYVTAPNKHDYTKHFKLNAGESAPHALIVNMVDKTQAEIDAEKNKGGGGNVIVEKPEVSWSTVKTVGMIGIVVGGAALLGGGVSFILTQVFQGDAVTEQNKSEANTPGACKSLSSNAYPPSGVPSDSTCASAVSYHTQALATQNAAVGLLIAGGVIEVAGIILFLVGGNVTKMPEKPAATSLHVVPMVSPTMAGLGLTGTF